MSKIDRIPAEGSTGRRIRLPEQPQSAELPLETVGQDLRAARLKRGDDLNVVSRTLKIRAEHLEALEEDRFDALPGRTYAMGFVRAYAEYLGFDPRSFVERYKVEIAGRDEGTRPTVTTIDGDEDGIPRGVVIVGLIVLALIAYGIYHLVFVSPPAPPPNPAIPPPALPNRVHSNVTAPPPAMPARSARQAAAAIISALPAGRTYGETNPHARVILVARAQTSVLVQDGTGKVYINRLLEPGDSYRVPDLVGLRLSTANAGAIGIELDGQAMGFAGAEGRPANSVSLDPQAIVDKFKGSNGRQ